MRELARVLGFVNLFAGVLLLGFPKVARTLIEVRGEFAKLPDNSLRFLGGWMLLLGGALVGAAEAPKIEAKIGEAIGTGWRRAA